MTPSKAEYTKDALLLRREIRTFLDKYVPEDGDDYEPVADFSNTPDDQQLNHEAHQVIEKLLDANDLLSTLDSSPSAPHKLIYNQADQRYHEDTPTGVAVHAGDLYEVLIPETEYDDAFWARDRVENNHQKEDGWYLVGNPDLSLNGLMVRYRA